MEADLNVAPPEAPAVDADAIDAHAPPLDDAPHARVGLDEPPHVTEEQVRGVVRSIGSGLGAVLGDDDVPDHWRFTDRELDDLVPPLTRIVNRRPKLRRAVIRSDEAAVAVVLAGYAGTNFAAGRAARHARQAAEEEPDGFAREADDPGRRGHAPAGGAAPGWPTGDGVPATPARGAPGP